MRNGQHRQERDSLDSFSSDSHDTYRSSATASPISILKSMSTSQSSPPSSRKKSVVIIAPSSMGSTNVTPKKKISFCFQLPPEAFENKKSAAEQNEHQSEDNTTSKNNIVNKSNEEGVLSNTTLDTIFNDIPMISKDMAHKAHRHRRSNSQHSILNMSLTSQTLFSTCSAGTEDNAVGDGLNSNDTSTLSPAHRYLLKRTSNCSTFQHHNRSQSMPAIPVTVVAAAEGF